MGDHILTKLLIFLVFAIGIAACAPEEEATTQVERPDAPAAPDTIRFDDSSHVGNTGRPQLVEFFTTWCPICNSLRPSVHALEAEYWGRVDFVYLDREADDNRDIVSQFGVRGQPVFFLLEPDGTIVRQWFGYADPAELAASMDEYLATGG